MDIQDIDFNRKGWLKQLVVQLENSSKIEITNIWDLGFRSGLLFGHPIRSITSPDLDFHLKDRIKIIYTEILYFNFTVISKGKATEQDFIQEAKCFMDKLVRKKTNSLFSANDTWAQVERMINQKCLVKPPWYAEFWPAFFYNSLLFSDLILWEDYLKLKQISDPEGYFQAFIQRFEAEIPKHKQDVFEALLVQKKPNKSIENEKLQNHLDMLKFIVDYVKGNELSVNSDELNLFACSFLFEHWIHLNFIKSNISIRDVNQTLINLARNIANKNKALIPLPSSQDEDLYRNELFSSFAKRLSYPPGEKTTHALKAKMDDLFDLDLLPIAYRNQKLGGRKKTSISE